MRSMLQHGSSTRARQTIGEVLEPPVLPGHSLCTSTQTSIDHHIYSLRSDISVSNFVLSTKLVRTCMSSSDQACTDKNLRLGRRSRQQRTVPSPRHNRLQYNGTAAAGGPVAAGN
jgi:hypothetical protein